MQRDKNTITTAVRMQLLKPLNEEWEQFGPTLRGLRSLSHRMLNAGMLGLAAELKLKESGGQWPGEREPKLYSYPHIKDELASYAAWAREKAAKLKGDERSRLEHLAGVAAAVPGDIMAYANRTTDGKFRNWLKQRANERLPMYKKNAPILLPPVAARVVEVGNAVRLSLKLRAKGRIDVALAPVSGSAWQAMRMVGDGTADAGDCKLIYDERKKKWYALLTVTRPRPAPPQMDPNVVVAVNRGRHNMLYAVSSCGASPASFKGDDVLKFKQAMRERRRQLGRHRQELGKGACGHGKARREARYVKVERAERNFVHTKCQQIGAWLERYCAKVGAGVVVIDDFGELEDEDLRYVPSWPYYQLKTACAWSVGKSSRRVHYHPSEYISSECPRCGSLDPGQAKWTGTFHCARCHFDRDNDFVACINMLRRFGADMSVWDARFKRERELAEALRDPAE